MTTESPTSQPIAFKAETRQLLDILIHSLYTEPEIFLRELISNASDALTRVDFEQLTNRDIHDPEVELAIRITVDKEAQTLSIHDSGIGMTAEELVENLGTIAHSGAREFMRAASESQRDLGDLIGQFGVGFYSAFMVADWIRVTTRSYKPDAEAVSWYSTGSDTYTIEPAERAARGTTITLHLKEDAQEFLEENRLRAIIRRHSDFIPFPIYIGDDENQVNRQTALWRQSPREVEEKEYNDFYQQLTLDFEPPLAQAHMAVDAPVQMYALLYIPASPERNMFSTRKEDGLKLYARKVLIQEYYKDLLPEYLSFVQGVVDSEDLPLNVSRESVQANRIVATLRKLVTGKVIDMLKNLADEDAETYAKFWQVYDRHIKQGVAIEQNDPEKLYPLLRFHTTQSPAGWSSLDDYISRLAPGQEEIYYILGDDVRSTAYSPHLDVFRQRDYEVLFLTDPVDAFMLVRLNKYRDYELKNVAQAEIELPATEAETGESPTRVTEAEAESLVERFKNQLGERVSTVRLTERLTDSPARLVDPEGAMNQEMQRVYRLLNREYDAPVKTLELNPRHRLILGLNKLEAGDERSALLIEQIYENALLIEGLHPDPAGMIGRIQQIMQAALGDESETS